MRRRFFVLTAVLALTIVALAACDQNGDEDGDDAGSFGDLGDSTPQEETPVTENGAAATPETTPEGENGDETTGDDPFTAQEEDTAVADVEATVEVTLVDYEIQMDSTVQAGIVQFALTNEGEHEHGVSVEAADGSIIGTMTAETGETEQLELELDPGQYVAFCPVGDHREAHGMETEFMVE